MTELATNVLYYSDNLDTQRRYLHFEEIRANA
jgi:hypothetical protein